MSKTSDVRNALSALIASTLPAYVQLPDSLDPEDNPNVMLQKGFAVGIGVGVNLSDIICPNNTRIQRVFNVILSNTYSPDLDAPNRETLENNLLDDVETLIAQIEINNTLGGVSVNSTYTDDAGIEYLTNDRKQYLLIILAITVDYFQ